MNIFEIKYRIKNAFLPTKISSNEFVLYHRMKGISIGEGTYFFDPSRTIIDTQRPWLLRIGQYCKITSNVTILCHDYSRSVLRRKYGEIIGEAQETIIGNNVFIGIGSTICMGAKIGDNVIIGAGSIVTGEVPDNVVVGGVPARIISSLEDYYFKRKQKYIDEAFLYFSKFCELYMRVPKENEMGPFWPLFMPRDEAILKKIGIKTNLSGDNESEIIRDFLNTKPVFDSYESFLETAKKQENIKNIERRGIFL